MPSHISRTIFTGTLSLRFNTQVLQLRIYCLDISSTQTTNSVLSKKVCMADIHAHFLCLSVYSVCNTYQFCVAAHRLFKLLPLYNFQNLKRVFSLYGHDFYKVLLFRNTIELQVIGNVGLELPEQNGQTKMTALTLRIILDFFKPQTIVGNYR